MNQLGKKRQPGVDIICGLDTSTKKCGSGRLPMMSTLEVLAILKIHASTLSHWITEGKFPKPKMYTGKRQKAYWEKIDVIRAVKALGL